MAIVRQRKREMVERQTLTLLVPVGLWGRSCGRSAVKDGRHYDVAREASFEETKAQYESRTAVGRRRLVVSTGERSTRSSHWARSGNADWDKRRRESRSLCSIFA
jgi:hypothetical protein